MALTVWSQAKRQAEQTQKAAEDQRAKALAEAQAEASATLASAERTAAARLKDAEANAAQMVQEQEARAEQAAEASKQQVRTWSIHGGLTDSVSVRMIGWLSGTRPLKLPTPKLPPQHCRCCIHSGSS